MTGFRISWERLTKFHAWRVGGTRFGGYDESGTFRWNGNFEFQVGPMHVSYMQDVPADDYADRLMLRHYRWYSVRAWADCVKVGPLSVTWYRWTDGRLRVSWFWFGGYERIIFGGSTCIPSKKRGYCRTHA